MDPPHAGAALTERNVALDPRASARTFFSASVDRPASMLTQTHGPSPHVVDALGELLLAEPRKL